MQTLLYLTNSHPKAESSQASCPMIVQLVYKFNPYYQECSLQQKIKLKLIICYFLSLTFFFMYLFTNQVYIAAHVTKGVSGQHTTV